MTQLPPHTLQAPITTESDATNQQQQQQQQPQHPPAPVFTSDDDDDGDDGCGHDASFSPEPISNMERLLLRALDYVDPRDIVVPPSHVAEPDAEPQPQPQQPQPQPQQPQPQQEQQPQPFVAPSLCIPRTHANIRKERIFAVFRSLGLGWIGRIDIVEKVDEKTGAPFIRVFIHFTKWFKNRQTQQFLHHLETNKSANVVYDEPWYWKVTKSFVPAPAVAPPPPHQPSRFPRPRIDLSATTTTQQQQQQQPKTPAAATVDAATTAVSGKGKKIAKSMGYESGKGLGKKADGKIVPVQVKKNVGRNGVGFDNNPSDEAAAAAPSSSTYWKTIAEAATTAAVRLSVSVSPSKVERRLVFSDTDTRAVSLNKST
jgi:hypothetical protein